MLDVSQEALVSRMRFVAIEWAMLDGVWQCELGTRRPSTNFKTLYSPT